MAKEKSVIKIEPEAKKLFAELLSNYQGPEDVLGEEGLLKKLTKGLIEAAMEREISSHLGYEKHDPAGANTGNSRNGYFSKTIRSDQGEVTIEVPRDREGSFEPLIVKNGERSFTGFDDKIISMYSKGMSTRDIQSHLQDMYGVDVSPDFVSNVTDGVIKEVLEWQNRPLDAVYPILYLDALRLKIKDEGHITNKAVYLIVGVNMQGQKDLLGIWIEKTEGAKFWLKVISELKERGVQDIFIACVDGLKGFPEAISTVFPKTEIQLCIVHMVRNSLKFVPWNQRKVVAADLKSIYGAVTQEEAEMQLESFSEKWDDKFPTISRSWKRNWSEVIPFFQFPMEIRKAIYTTNVIESLNYSLRKITKTRASFPSDEAAIKLVYLGIKNVSRKWTMPIRNWKQALNQFALIYEDRFIEA